MVKKFSKGFREFLIKSAVFVVLFVLIQLAITYYISKPDIFYQIKLFSTVTLALSAFLCSIFFFSINKDKIMKLASYCPKLSESLISLILFFLSILIYIKYQSFLANNLELVKESLLFYNGLWLFILFIIFISILLLIFGFSFCKYFLKEYKEWVVFILIGTAIVYWFINFFQGLWEPISGIVAGSVNNLLNFLGNSSIYYVNELPILVFNGFSVGIAKTCSGIDSVLLFTGLYLGILAWDWKILDKKKAFWMYFVGVFGVFLLNIIRIFILILIGAYISKSFALNTFHTNASSLLFIIYFAIFWGFSYKWMRIKGQRDKFK